MRQMVAVILVQRLEGNLKREQKRYKSQPNIHKIIYGHIYSRLEKNCIRCLKDKRLSA